MRISVLIIVSLFLGFANTIASPVIEADTLDPEVRKADSLARAGVKLVDKKEYEKAIEIFNKAIELEPGNPKYKYEKGLAYYQTRKFDSTISILSSLKDEEEILSDHFFVLLANSYDYKEQYKKAVEIYEEGLEIFPNSGELYMEYGVHYFQAKKDRKRAVKVWEAGIKADPDYPKCYYALARHFIFTDELIWAVIYGEIFLNISDNTSLLNDASFLLNNAYLEAFYKVQDTTTGATDVDFTSVRYRGKNLKESDFLAFPFVYQKIMERAAEGLLPPEKTDFKIEDFYKIRKKFIEIWYKEEWNKRYSNALFDLHKKMIDDGHFEAYSYWLLNAAREKEAEAWLNKGNNKQKISDFGRWMTKNQLKLHKGNYIARFKY